MVDGEVAAVLQLTKMCADKAYEDYVCATGFTCKRTVSIWELSLNNQQSATCISITAKAKISMHRTLQAVSGFLYVTSQLMQLVLQFRYLSILVDLVFMATLSIVCGSLALNTSYKTTMIISQTHRYHNRYCLAVLTHDSVSDSCPHM